MGDLEGAKGFLTMAPADKASDPAIAAARAAVELAEQAASLGDTKELDAKVAANPEGPPGALRSGAGAQRARSNARRRSII